MQPSEQGFHVYKRNRKGEGVSPWIVLRSTGKEKKMKDYASAQPRSRRGSRRGRQGTIAMVPACVAAAAAALTV